MRLCTIVGDVILRDPDVAGVRLADRQHRRRADREHRPLFHRRSSRATSASSPPRRSSTGCGRSSPRSQGANLFLQPAQDITVGGRIARGSFQYTLQDANIAELTEWSQKMLDKMRTLPQLADVTSDLLANAPQLQITINRDQASRFGISPQTIDDTLNDAYGQRQITQYFTQLNTYFVILEILPELQKDLSTLDRLYVKSPLTGAAVPLSALVDVDMQRRRAAVDLPPGPVPGRDPDLQSAARRRARRGGRCHHRGGARDRHAAVGHRDLPGQRPGVPDLAASEPALIAAALVVVYIILGMLYESFIHPLTILSTLPSAGVGALLALNLGHMDLSVIGIIGIILLIGIVKKNGIMLVDFAIAAERDRHMAPLDAIREACLLRFRPILMTTAAAMLAGLPLALGTGTGSELRQPLGYAMVGGLALSQLLTLYTTPVVYLYLDRLQTWLFGERRGPVEATEEAAPHAVAAE